MRYGMLITNDERDLDQTRAAAMETVRKEIGAWFERWAPAGKIADAGAHLQRTRVAKTVRPGPDGTPEVTDGPYLELKEVVCGLVVLEADDIDDAVAVAATWPLIRGRGAVEVRPLFEND
jgi:hypothetical protein